LSAGEMHESSRQWLSELKFIKDEQLFLNDLVKSYTLQLIDKNFFEQSKKVIGQIQQSEEELSSLFKKMQAHEKQLDIMVDGIDQLKIEEAYIATHKELMGALNEYIASYRQVKARLFKLMAAIIKKDKQKHLLN
jgi:hypothetical protein